jgi:hypothetical protein
VGEAVNVVVVGSGASTVMYPSLMGPVGEAPMPPNVGWKALPVTGRSLVLPVGF